MENNKIVLLAGAGFSTHAVYHALSKDYCISRVIIEDKVNRKLFLKRRIKNLGWITVIGQILFQAFIVKVLDATSKKRVQQLTTALRLDGSEIPASIITRVPSVNDAATMALLQQEAPDLVVVNGTRIIAKKILTGISCPFINTHAGITPKYRGVHGTYWALVHKDKANSGVTVHLVDPGIDTGGVLYQETVTPTLADNFVTYPLLQLGAGIPLLRQAINDAFANQLQVKQTTGESKLWYHPTIWQYLYHRIVHNVK